jgi:hypothetical protein
MVTRAREAEKLLPRQVERAQYDAAVARRRLRAVAPALRHVAQTLEADWHDTLDHRQQAQPDDETRRANRHHVLNAQQQVEIRRLATDFPSLWSPPATSHQDKKRMARLLIEEGTFKRDGSSVTLCMRLKAGAILTRMVRWSRSGNKPTMIDPALLSRIDDLSAHHTAGEVATARNAAGIVHPTRGEFATNAVVY